MLILRSGHVAMSNSGAKDNKLDRHTVVSDDPRVVGMTTYDNFTDSPLAPRLTTFCFQCNFAL